MADNHSHQDAEKSKKNVYIGLSEVARQAGISRAGASMALRNHPRISKETRARVVQIADQLGYRSNPLLSRIVGIKRKKARSSDGMPMAIITFGHPHTTGFDIAGVKHAQDYGKRHGYSVQHFHLPDHKGPTHLSRLLYHRGIEAVLIDSCLHPSFAKEFDWSHFSAVAISSGYYELPINHVDVDAFADMVLLWQKAREAGAKRIGIIFYQEAVVPVDRPLRMAALNHCLKNDPDIKHMFYLEMLSDHLPNLRRWLDQSKPDVIIGFSPAVYWWLTDVGWTIGPKQRFICISMTHATSQVTGPEHKTLAGLIKGDEKMIMAAIDQLDLQVRRFERGPASVQKRILIASEWMDGDSLTSSKLEKISTQKSNANKK